MAHARPEKGFTTIELLIVLAIAGFLLLIIFLALPALQRNARNTQRRHDVRLIAAAREEYDVTFHVTAGYGDATCGTAGGGPHFAGFCGYLRSLSFYDPENVRIINNAHTAPTTIPTVDAEQIITISYVRCNGNTPTTDDATFHSVAIIYAVETAGDIEPQCSDAGVSGNN